MGFKSVTKYALILYNISRCISLLLLNFLLEMSKLDKISGELWY